MLFVLRMGLAEWVSSALDAVGFEYSPEMVTVRDSSKVEERFVEQSGGSECEFS